MILVDSSVWIQAWRGRDADVIATLARLVEGERVRINPLIRTELLQGARDGRHQQQLRHLLEPIRVQPLPEALWEESPKLYLQCRQRGVTLTTIDALIAVHAKIGKMQLWSLDGIYRKIPHFSHQLFHS